MPLTRRRLMQVAGVLPWQLGLWTGAARADDRKFTHALTLFTDIKYPADFKHFDYVNPAAPKGGKIRMLGLGSFDSLNPYSYKGDPAAGVDNDTLLTSSFDEASTEYGLVAESVWAPDDHSMVVYRLRPEARFDDGKAMTPEDVIWSMMTLREIHPAYNGYYKNVAKAEQTGDHEVTFAFDVKGNRELPLITGQLPVLPKHWWTGTDATGKQRDISAPTLEVPLGSGAYKVVDVKTGSSIRMQRVADYWGKDLPVNIGTNNFDEIEIVYFRDSNVAFEAFKGGQFDFNVESSAKNWATGYNFPAIQDGRVIKELIALKQANGMQCFAFNTRKPKFQDARLRNAFNYAFDFEWMNANLFYGQNTRCRSYFNNSEMEAKGLPSPEELKLLEPLKDQIPPEVFTAEYTNPVFQDESARRPNLRKASQLLAEAGWTFNSDADKPVLVNAQGQKLDIEILLDSPTFERIALPYKQQLELLGITVTIKTIDTAQYERRTKTFDYDMIVGNWGQSLSPGNEQRDFWGSAATDREGSRNYVGIKSAAIDKLVDAVILAPDRAGLITACRALDRVLTWSHFVVPMWFMPATRTARWDKFDHPDKSPDYNLGFPSTWWWDEEKAKKVAAG